METEKWMHNESRRDDLRFDRLAERRRCANSCLYNSELVNNESKKKKCVKRERVIAARHSDSNEMKNVDLGFGKHRPTLSRNVLLIFSSERMEEFPIHFTRKFVLHSFITLYLRLNEYLFHFQWT